MSPEEIIEKCLEMIGEHFDAVQIMCENSDASGSRAIYKGCGSWYARMGMAHEFIEKDKAQEHAQQISDKLAPEIPPDSDVLP